MRLYLRPVTTILSIFILLGGSLLAHPTMHDKIQEIVDAEARFYYFSGSVLVARGDSIIYEDAFGQASREFQVPNTLQTKFNIGSITKTFTALGILQLAEQGQIGLQDTLAKWLPDCPVPEKNQITIHQLLTHTSGLYDYANSDLVMETIFKRGIKELMPYVYGSGLLSPPGKAVHYSSGGYILLGAIIEKVTGMDYMDYIRENIFKPAQMANTDFLYAEDVVYNKAIGYKQTDRDHYINRGLLYFPPGPDGGIYSTVEDLLRYVRNLQQGNLLSREYLNLLMTPVTEFVADRGRVAYGWWVDSIGNQEVVYHTGGTPGFSSSVYIFPDLQYTAIVLSNSFRGTTGITSSINLALAGSPYEIADQNTYDLQKGIDLYYAGDNKGVIGLMDKIIRSDKPARRAYYFAGAARVNEGIEIPQALDYLDKYIGQSDSLSISSIAFAWFKKGKGYEEIKNPQQAIQCYEKSLALNPDQKAAKEALDRLTKN